MLDTMRFQIGKADAASTTSNHQGLDDFPTFTVRAADHGGFGDVRKTIEDLFDFGRKDQEPGGLDDVFFPVDDRKEAIAVAPGNVAGVEPTASKRTGRFFGVVEITLHY